MSGQNNILLSYGAAAAGNGLLTNLVSYYKCDESSGTIVDAHGTDDSTAASVTYGATGVINNALDFESSSSNYVSFGAARDFSSYGDFTIDLSVKLESQPSGTAGTPGSYRYFYSNSSLSGEQVYLRYQIISGVYYIYFGTYRAFPYAESYTRYNVTLSLATWYHIFAIHSGTDWQLYLNNSLVSSAVSSGNVLLGGQTDYMGATAATGSISRWHDGLIDELGIWSEALDSSKRSARYNGGSILPYSSFTS